GGCFALPQRLNDAAGRGWPVAASIPFCPERLSRNEKISCCCCGRMSCRACCPPTGDTGRPDEERDKDRCTPIQGLQNRLRVAGERAFQGHEVDQSLFQDHRQICQSLWCA